MHTSIESALASANIQSNSVFFPEEINKATYAKIKKMLLDIRGTWKGGKVGKFQFDFDPASLINTYLVSGQWPKKNPYALFPTPKSIIDYALQETYAGASRWFGFDVVRILEPNAGQGDLIDAVVKDFEQAGIACEVTCCEIDPVNVLILKGKGYNVIAGDFLKQSDLGEFDLVIMNPPFQGTAFVKHVFHAQSMLTKNGKLVSVLPTSLFGKTTKLAETLKEQVSAVNMGEFQDCIFEGGTFANTEIETMVVTLYRTLVTDTEMLQLQDYAAHLITLFVNNDYTLNETVNKCLTRQQLGAMSQTITDSYLNEAPYSFVNATIMDIAITTLMHTIEPDDKIVEHKQDCSDKEYSAPVITSHVDELLDKISSQVEIIGNRLTSEPIQKIERQLSFSLA